ncbi:hypothetical protein [Hafnia alvei]|uniref:hypothetical protein n=1 Tax=Hafnia alvei TaxID=569 RepID=UPI000E00DC30|nr:hypothetical protein [Hafnia alvei]STQ72496.1 Uncharacterised protein [Hafnia alvei]
MNKARLLTLDSQKLQENALLSIKLGIEDFELSQKELNNGGNPARALSAVRNLFAGMLLLFKYKIATSVNTPEDAYLLIFNPPNVLPKPDGEGGVLWAPEGKFKTTTIDTTTIEQRFKSFNIDVDWNTIKQLQNVRNHLEHLHPINTLGEVAGFVANLFPILSDFIKNQLNKDPLELLEESWSKMLKHNAFYETKRKECDQSWEFSGIPENMKNLLQKCSCDECHSELLAVSQESLTDRLTVKDNEENFTYKCISCGHSDLITPLLLQALNEDHDYDYYDYDNYNIEVCYQCSRNTFLIDEQLCVWCGTTLDYEKCNICGELLKQDDQDNDGLCGYHYSLVNKGD